MFFSFNLSRRHREKERFFERWPSGTPYKDRGFMAEYDLIRKLAALCTASGVIGEKLARAESLIQSWAVGAECSIYLLDEASGGFVLGSPVPPVQGGEGGVRVSGRVESYGPGEGLPGLLSGTAGEAHTEVFGDGRFDGGTDAGLAGFAGASVFALKGPERLYGLLYLKFRERTSLEPAELALITAIVAQLELILGFEELFSRNAELADKLDEYRGRLKGVEKLAGLADMAATLAHEIKNPLVSIGGFASRLRRKLGPGSEHAQCVEQILAEIQRLEGVLDGVTSFLRDAPLELVADDLNVIIEEALGLFDEEFSSHGIEVVRDLYPGRLSVAADREELKIAFDNLIANAIQSMDKGGTLTLTTAVEEGLAVATVGDTGCGIDSAHVCDIFNPFFTTKERGTGLGLSITNSIIARHKGSIEVIAQEGKGAVFAVRLPMATVAC